MASYLSAPNGTMIPGNSLTSPLGLYTLLFTKHTCQLVLINNSNGATTPLTPTEVGATTLCFTSNQLVIEDIPPPPTAPIVMWSSPSSGAVPLAGLDVLDSGQAVLYDENGDKIWVQPPSASAAAIGAEVAELRAAIDQVARRFAKLSGDLAPFIVTDRQKLAEAGMNGATTEYKMVTGLRPSALSKEEAEDTGT
jgi:hypothetical protein